MNFNLPINNLAGIGTKTRAKLYKMGIRTLQDLLWHFPHRYEDFSRIVSIAKIRPEQKNCVYGTILDIKNSQSLRKHIIITKALIQDKTGAIEAVWFRQPYLTNVLKKGDKVCLAGKATLSRQGLQLSSPVYERIVPDIIPDITDNQSDIKSFQNVLNKNIPDKQMSGLLHTGRLVPFYPKTQLLSSRYLRSIISQVLEKWQSKIPEYLPPQIIKQNNLMGLPEALKQIHFPETIQQARKARQRFVFEDLFLVALSTLKKKYYFKAQKAPAIPTHIKVIKDFVDSLGFTLTNAQKKCAWQILKDIERPMPMARLLEGDVGSGKTVVAVLAALNVIKQGFQVAIMAPTEVLSKQHFREVGSMLWPFKVKIALLTGKQDKITSVKLEHETLEISRKKLLEQIEQGEIQLLIGTHALIQDKVRFRNLGLAIIDEQHRFGVEQRAKLIKNARDRQTPHFLAMTATPIPRSLALTIYGNLDLSVLDEMPKGRKRVKTEIVSSKKRQCAYNFIKKEIKKGNQAFIIYPRIESQITNHAMPATHLLARQDKQELRIKNKSALSWAEVKAVNEEYKKLSEKIFPEFKVGKLHGQMKTSEKTKIMNQFKKGKIDVLVSTSVVEVGVDVPQATVIMIEGAERFGLAQLHQFRGRVGRSSKQAYCFLLTTSGAQTQRLRAMKKLKNGFELAQKDLEIRGPGSLYGVQQSGLPDLAIKGLGDIKLIEQTRSLAKDFLIQNRNFKKYPLLKQRLQKIEKKLKLE